MAGRRQEAGCFELQLMELTLVPLASASPLFVCSPVEQEPQGLVRASDEYNVRNSRV